MTDFPLDADNNVALDNGDLHINTRREDVKQRVRQRLKLILGEWFRDPSDGVDYQNKILVRDFRASFVDREVRKNVMKTEGITSITDIQIERDHTGQSATIIVKYKDDSDTKEQEVKSSI